MGTWFRHSIFYEALGLTQVVICGLIGFLGGIAVELIKAAAPGHWWWLMLPQYGWGISAFVLTFLVCLCVADARRLARLRTECARLKDRLPKIELSAIKAAKLSGSIGSPYVVQLWFKNAPVTSSPESIADHVTAHVTINNKHLGAPLQFYARWAKATAPDHMGFDDTDEATIMRPDNLPAKLVVALKHVEDRSVFGFSVENFHSHADGRHPSYGCPPGTYAMTVALRGIGVNRDFDFRLHNPGTHQHEFSVLPRNLRNNESLIYKAVRFCVSRNPAL